MANSPAPFAPKHINADTSNNSIFDSLNFKPLPNELNDYDQVAYHVKLSVVSDIPEIDNEIIIAETGTTELNIQSFVCDSFVGSDNTTRNTSVTKMHLEILEFYGFDFMNRIIEATTELGVRNYCKTPFKVELKFMGRDASTGKAIANIYGSKVWAWKVLINTISTKVTESGCVHSLDLFPIGDSAGTDDYMRLPESYTFTGKTCGDILKNLGDIMEQNINEKYAGIKMVKYRFDAVPYPSTAQSPVKTPLDHVVTNESHIDSSRAPDQATTNTGISISELVDILHSNSNTAVTLANSVGTAAPVNTNQPNKPHVTLCRIEKTVEYGNYISLYQDYEKTITYILVPYDTVRVIGNMDTYLNINKPDNTAKRIEHINALKCMQKEYDYIFTGKNTEVTKFNIDLSFDYNVSVEIMLGVMNYANGTAGQQYSDESRKRTFNFQFAQDTTDLRNLNEAHSDNKIPWSDKDKARATELQDRINKNRKQANQNSVDAENQDKSRVAKTKLDLQNKKKSTYADDEDYSDAMGHLESLPITLRQTPGLANQYDGVIESSYDTRRSIFAGILDQMYGSMDNNLGVLDVEIRGDPYWLGPAGYRELFANGFCTIGTEDVKLPTFTIPARTPDEENWANYAMAENVIVFRYKVPSGFDEKTGKAIIRENNSYTGFYSVNQVTHKFEGGVFTQKLSGFRIPGAEVSNVLRGQDINPEATAPKKTEKPLTPEEQKAHDYVQNIVDKNKADDKAIQDRKEAQTKWLEDKWHGFTSLF